MTTRVLRTAVAASALAALLGGGCDAGSGEPGPGPARPEGEPVGTTEPPHFRGEREVTLAAGQLSVGGGSCAEDDAPYWVCDPLQEDRFRAWHEPRAATLREASMDVAQGGLSWAVTVRFDRPGTRVLTDVRDQAQGLGAAVLVLDGGDEVLLSATVPDVEDGVLQVDRLTKPDAWDLVERLAGE